MSTDPVAVSSSRVTREFLILVALIVAAAAAFIGTREVAAYNRSIRVADAAVWFEKGRTAFDAGDIEVASGHLRRAATLNPERVEYRLALARAFVAGRRDVDARAVLASVLEQRPDDSEANLQLARLEVRSDRVDEAVRRYQSALMALWPPAEGERRRQTRLELIDYLLAQRRTGRALSELLVLYADLPADTEAQVGIGRRLLAAGDAQRASALFDQVLATTPRNLAARVGAGEAAFALGNYAVALRSLAGVPADAAGVAEIRAVARLVLDRDPLAPRLGAGERLRRLSASAADLLEPLDGCVRNTPAGTGPAVVSLAALRPELLRYVDALAPRRRGASQADALTARDSVEDGLDLLLRVVRGRVTAHCGPPLAIEKALTLIGARHELEGA